VHVPPAFANIAVQLGLAQPGASGGPYTPLTVPAEYDPRPQPCYTYRTVNTGLCGADYAQSGAAVIGVSLCRAAASAGTATVPPRVSVQYALALAHMATGNGSVCSGGAVGMHVLRPFVQLKATAAAQLGVALPLLGCNASAAAGGRGCDSGCAPFVEPLCARDSTAGTVPQTAVPSGGVGGPSTCAQAFNAQQCANTGPSRALDVDSFAMTKASPSVRPAGRASPVASLATPHNPHPPSPQPSIACCRPPANSVRRTCTSRRQPA